MNKKPVVFRPCTIEDDGCVLRQQYCPECGGAGEVDVLWDQGYHPGLSNEEAMNKAGEVHHSEVCEYCNGSGEVYV